MSASVTTPNVYTTGAKEVLVTRDPVFKHPAIYQGHYIGRQPHSYLPLAIVVTIINPLIGPIALLFAYMSIRSYKHGDIKYSHKWSQYAFMMGMITIVASIVIYITIGFSLSPQGLKGGYTL